MIRATPGSTVKDTFGACTITLYIAPIRSDRKASGFVAKYTSLFLLPLTAPGADTLYDMPEESGFAWPNLKTRMSLNLPVTLMAELA